MFNRRKKTALVTGASSGMGKEIAKRLIEDGFQGYVAARHVDKMNDLAKLGATKEKDAKAQVADFSMLSASGAPWRKGGWQALSFRTYRFPEAVGEDC